MNTLTKALIYVLAVYITDYLLVGIAFRTIEAGILVAGCMAVINIFVKPIIKLFSLPLTLFTMGMFPFVMNTLLVWAVYIIIPDFAIFGSFLFKFIWATAFGLCLSIVTVILEQITGYNLPGGNNI